jgi:hypothetical protein
MSRFTIHLPENKKGNVWRLDMVNMRHIDYISFKPKSAKVVSSSEPVYTFKAFKYEITIPDEESSVVHILYKFANGEWFTDYIDKKPIEDKELLVIINAIIDREKELNDM